VNDASRYCEGPGPDGNTCGRPAFRGVMEDRPLCEAHQKQQQRNGRLTPIAPTLSLEARALEAALAWVEASSVDSDDYEARRRAALNAAAALGRKLNNDLIREGIRRAKRRGVKMGRPSKIEARQLIATLRRVKRVADVAKALGVSERTVQRHKRRGGKK
jgi:DNA-binding NarL/FixJ family response regulator